MAKSLDGVMIGTTHFINAVVQRRSLTRVAALRLGMPASATLPPFCDWPEDLAALVRHTAVAGLTPAGVGRLLGELGARPRWRVHTYRHDFPDVSVLRPAMLARVLTGEDSVMRAQRLLRMVHRSAALVHANGA